MKYIKASLLAKSLGISRYTVRTWCQQQPGLARKKGRDWYIRVSELAKRDGLDPVKVLTLTREKWVKAVELSERSGISRRTIAHWCKTKSDFALRVGRIWYISPTELGATQDQVELMNRWYPHGAAVKFLEVMSNEAE